MKTAIPDVFPSPELFKTVLNAEECPMLAILTPTGVVGNSLQKNADEHTGVDSSAHWNGARN